MPKPPARPPSDPDTGTLPDDIPPVHVLEAAQVQDRKEAEDLLSGFNRPGREPKRPHEERDFVDYYARKKKGAPATPRAAFQHLARPVAAPTHPKARWDERPARDMPPWAGWVGIGALMIGVGGIVAFVATSEPSTKRVATMTSAATTVTSATSESSRDAIPPPPPVSVAADPTAMTTTPIMVTPSAPSAATRTKRDRHSAASGATEPTSTAGPARTTLPAAGAGTIGPTRDDLIRDM